MNSQTSRKRLASVPYVYPSRLPFVDDRENCLVSQMPTFVVFKDGAKLDEVVGANPGKLEVCLIWLLGNMIWSLIESIAISLGGVVCRINGSIGLGSYGCFVCTLYDILRLRALSDVYNQSV